jgi:hypothetical protein
MLGTANIKVRPLKLALLVDPNSASQVREAIRLACGLWGGMFFPIIPAYRRMPASWWAGSVPVPSAKAVVQGYIDAFDPDVLVQFGADLPSHIDNTRLTVIKPQDVFGGPSSARELGPSFGIGAIDLLRDIFKEYFKYKAKYPAKVVVPTIPNKLGLFWASVFGEYDSRMSARIDDELSTALVS